MKYLLLLLLLTGCVSATYRNGEQSVTYRDLFKRASDVSVDWGPVQIDIGDMSSEITAQDMISTLKVLSALKAPEEQ